MTIKKAIICKNIDEVVDILEDKDDNLKILAGGTDLLVMIRNKKIHPETLVDISSIDELKKIEVLDKYIEIGAGVTFTDIVNSDLFDDNLYGLHKASRMVGSPQIRNKATIGGNIINGSSAADIIPPLLCLDASLIYRSRDGERQVRLEDFYTDNKNNGIGKNELLTKIRFERLNKNAKLSFAKLGLRDALAIARISNSVLMELDEGKNIIDIKVASGALGKYPLRERKVEEYLKGEKYNKETRDGAVEMIQRAMTERLEGRSTHPYKKIAVESTFREALEEVI